MTKNVERTTNYLNDKSNNFFDYESMTGWHLNPSRRLLCISLPFPYRNKKTNHINKQKNQPYFSTVTFKFNSPWRKQQTLYQVSINSTITFFFISDHSFIHSTCFISTNTHFQFLPHIVFVFFCFSIYNPVLLIDFS
jgi:hypothetical protein